MFMLPDTMGTQNDVFTRRLTTLIPQAGDGICPTVSQYNETISASYTAWSKHVFNAKQQRPGGFSAADGLLDLVQRVPDFRAHPSHAFSIHEGTSPLMRYALEWMTTEDSTCKRPVKRTYHYQILGRRQPLVCRLLNGAEDGFPSLGLPADQMKHFTRLVLAWAFILSSRWVDILTAAGEEVSMTLQDNVDGEGFWEVIIEQQWEAMMTRGQDTFYAPWSIQRHVLNPELVRCPGKARLLSTSTNQPRGSPTSLRAFNSLEAFCLSEGVTKDCSAAALALVLMFPEHSAGSITLPPLVAIGREGHGPRTAEALYLEDIYDCLGRCITMSCCKEGIASLLCSGLFEPRIPCNLIGAHLAGIGRAIEHVRKNPEGLAQVLTGLIPRASSLWLAAIRIGQANTILDYALGGMPPINLLMASWLGIPQSFVQTGHDQISSRDGFIPRALEFTTMYFVESNANIPITPSPPFGETAVSQMNLDTRQHLFHNHRPLQAVTYWILRTEELYAVQTNLLSERLNLRLPSIPRASAGESCKTE